MKILGVIPARYNSSRFPGKPLIDLAGKTMIQRVYEGAKKSRLLNELIVATDDQRIYDHVHSFGGKAMMTKESHSTGTDRCAEVLKRLENEGFDVLINIQGDEPLVDAKQLDELLESFKNPLTQIATIATRKITEQDLVNSNRIKVVVNHLNNAMYFSRSAVPNFKNSKQLPLDSYPYLRHIGLYAFRKTVLLEISALSETLLEKTESLEQLRWMFYGFTIFVKQSDIETPNIDVAEDVAEILNQLSL
jgi:3-deoxy-manno-octulosonate cytidylyltransferase (CMP-KDO synthetase)